MGSVEEFRNNFLHLCREYRIDPQEAVLRQLGVAQKSHNKSKGYVLNLSTNSLTGKTCVALAKVLATDRTFADIRLNDCMLTEEGMRSLAHGMAQNVICKKMDLKGNNIRGSAAEGLGKMLRHNSTLLSVCLEWNSLGMLDSSFTVFCDGLATNASLQSLDLRNNQISHDGASQLAEALRRNARLKSLDLRWNNVGLLGGRALLEAMNYNKTLVRIELAGNNTPVDVLKAIETAVSHNAERSSLTSDYQNRNSMLTKEIQVLKKGKNSEMVELLDKLDKQDDVMKRSSKSTSGRIQQLNDALSDSKENFKNLNAKLAIAESELALTESRNSELGSMLSKLKEEQHTMSKIHQTELRREREEKSMIDTKLCKDLMELSEKNSNLQRQYDDVDRKCRLQQDNLCQLKEQLTHSQADLKLKTAHLEERIALEKQKTKEAYRDADVIKQKEIDRVRREAEETEQIQKERINKLEINRIELEEDLSRQKNFLASEKISAEEMLMSAKQKIRYEEEQRCKQMEDKIRMLQLSKDELSSHASQQTNTITDMQTKNSNLVLDNESLKRRIEDMQTELAGKNNEIMEETSKVRMDLNRRIEKLETERQSKGELYDRISELEKELSELRSSHRNTVDSSGKEIQILKDKLTMRETEIHQMKESDTQRANMLQSAVQNYIGKTYTPTAN